MVYHFERVGSLQLQEQPLSFVSAVICHKDTRESGDEITMGWFAFKILEQTTLWLLARKRDTV